MEYVMHQYINGALLRRLFCGALVFLCLLFFVNPELFQPTPPLVTVNSGMYGNLDQEDELHPFSLAHSYRQMQIKTLSEAITTKFTTVPKYQAEQIVKAALKESTKRGIAPTLILAIIAVESSFNPVIISGNDHGLMQVNTYWQKEVTEEVGGPKALLDPLKNIYAGTKIFANYLLRTNGNTRQALRKFNGEGKANDYPSTVLNQQKFFDSALLAQST